MPWNSTFPLGTVSVRANKPIGQQNTTYIETTMGKTAAGTNTVTTRDHFWSVGVNVDGRHRFIQSPKFEAPGGTAADPLLGTSMDGVTYIRLVNSSIGRVEGFYRNIQGIYQYIPSFISGTIVVTASYQSVVALPSNVYGEIIFFRSGTTGRTVIQSGIFKTSNNTCDAFSIPIRFSSDDETDEIDRTRINLVFGNGTQASGLNLRVKVLTASAGDSWDYRITYRAI